jgi:hypothetical protein
MEMKSCRRWEIDQEIVVQIVLEIQSISNTISLLLLVTYKIKFLGTDLFPVTVDQIDGNDFELRQELIPLYNRQVNATLRAIKENVNGYKCKENACVSFSWEVSQLTISVVLDIL